MAWWEAIGPILSGVGALGSLFDKGSSGTETTRQTPATWGEVGHGGEAIWDTAIDKIFGTPADSAAIRTDLNEASRAEAEKIRGLINQYEGVPGYESTVATLKQQLLPYLQGGGKSLEQMMTEDEASKKKASDAYLAKMTGLDTDVISALTDLTNKYTSDLGGYKEKLNTPAFFLNMGGKNVGVQTRGTRSAIEQLSDLSNAIYNAGANQANTKYGVGQNAAERALTAAETYTPNAAKLNYINTIWPMAMQMQGLRFGLPSQSTTGTVSGPSFLEKLGNIAGVAEQVIPQLQNIFGKKETTET